MSRAMGLLLLIALGGLQIANFTWLYHDLAWVATIPYRMAQFAVAPAFFLFSNPLLRPQSTSGFRPALLWHAAPVLLFPWLPEKISLPLVFVVGAGYLLWLARSLYALRQERAGFRVEIVLLGGVFAIAIGASVLGVVQSSLPGKLFFSLYAIAIGTAFLLVQIVLSLRPQLSTEVSEVVQTAYNNSTLGNVDCDAMLSRLEQMMKADRIYVDPELSLRSLASRMGLSPHQLSELMNNRLGKGFSRYLREQRISAAKAMLCDEPSVSVLAVGLGVGFTSQSNFYEAFREIEGTTPGQYRKVRSRSGAPR
jgi:AraC-like DNA-binding protein